jgi:CheY-like chemotaxis protein
MRRILVVGDDLHVGQAIRVATADGGATGLVALDNATFDSMVVDVFMPHMKGFEAIRLFHERAPTVPLIAISGYAFSGTESTGSEFLRPGTRLGATRCLRRPFKPMTLVGVIDECLWAAEPHRRQVATLGAVADSLSGLQAKPNLPDLTMDAPREPRRSGGRLSQRTATSVLEPSAGDGEMRRSWNGDWKGDQRAARFGICGTIRTK